MNPTSSGDMKKHLILFACFLVATAAAVRILRHLGLIALPPNVAPVAAMAMFGGAYLPRRVAVALPLAAMLLSDAAIGFYTPAIMASVYVSFAVSACIGLLLRNRANVARIAAGSLAGSCIFFLVTNGAVWAFGTMYAPTFPGLLDSYLAGLPFFRNTILGDLAFAGTMFGAYELAQYLARRRRVAFDAH